MKKNKTLTRLIIFSISSKITSLLPFSGCGITAEGMKTISNYLSQDGIVLEELDLGLKEKNQHFISNIKQEPTILEMKSVFILLKD